MLNQKPKGYVPWSPTRKVQEIVDHVKAMIEPGGELETVRPVTIRQVYYRLIAKHGYPKTEQFAKNLGSYLVKARRAGMIPFEAIDDQGIMHAKAHFDLGPNSQIEKARRLLRGDGYRLDHQYGQNVRLFIWAEAAGLVRQIEAVAQMYGVEVASGGGQPSLSFNWKMAKRLSDLCLDGENRSAEILMLGDYDEAGYVITSTGGRDISKFAVVNYGLDVRITRIALTADQVIERRIMTAPSKREDPRFPSEHGYLWPGIGGDPEATAQLEAIPPLELQQLVRDEIEARLDPDMVAVMKQIQAKHVEVIRAKGAALSYRRLGRPPISDDTAARIHALRAQGLSVRAVAAQTGVAKSSVARLVQKGSAG